MTDAEINRHLALAIGWDEEQIETSAGCDSVILPSPDPGENYRVFDYRDPAVIWPIAERFDAFPWKSEESWYAAIGYIRCHADTAAKAVAFAVIKTNNT